MIDLRKIWSSPCLPSLPHVAGKLIEISRNPETEISAIVELLKSDPALTAKVLKTTNSSYFGLASKVTGLEHAVSLLGKNAVTSLALSFSLTEGAMDDGPLGEAYSAYWLQSTVHAAAAESLSAQLCPQRSEDCFLAGLLIDLGRLALLKTVAQEYLPVLDAANALQRNLAEVETEMLGTDHSAIGAELARRWNLPETLQQAIALHDKPPETFRASGAIQDRNLVCVAAVAAAVGDYFCGSSKGTALERLRSLGSTLCDLTGPGLDEFLDGLRPKIEHTAAVFALNVDLPDPHDLLAQANEQLAQLAMSAHAESAQAKARHEAIEKEKQELEVRNEQLRQQTFRDPLTRVYNRQFLEESLTRETHCAARSAAPLGVIFIDVDHFKKLNDTYGHAYGDEVLKRVAWVINDTIRGTDVLARYGGEEFVVLVSQTSEKGFERLAERIRLRVESEQFVHAGKAVAVTVSVGAAITIPDRQGATVGKTLVEAADQAMYESKQNGRNQVHVRNLMSDLDRRLISSANQKRFSRWLVSKGIVDMMTVSRALLQCRHEHVRTGELGLRLGMLDEDQVQSIVQAQEHSGRRFGETALRLGHLTGLQLAVLLALQQENPRDLAVALVRRGAIDPSKIQALIDAYEFEAGIGAPLQTA